MTHPEVSVLMTVYNGGSYLGAAVESILNQDFRNFEFLIVDDGSTDGSVRLIESLDDPRIRLVRAPHLGLVSALNLGLAQAQGRYIARMDADDISRADRLAVQVAHLAANTNVGLVCSNVRVINAEGQVVGSQRESWKDKSFLRDGLLYRRAMKPVIHPSVMMRREVAEKLGGYRHFEAAEDRDFWLRAIDHYQFDRLAYDLIDYRIHPGGISRAKRSIQEISSAMTVINWMVNKDSRVDMFVENSELFNTLTEAVRRRIELDILPGAIAFREARSAFRSGNRRQGLFAMMAAVAKHGGRALPDGARKEIVRIIDAAVASACSSLKIGDTKWTI